MSRALRYWLVTLVSFASIISSAQSSTSSISGSVLDDSGHPLAKVKVGILLDQPVTETVTDADGNFHFEQLAPGKYQVFVERTGYVPVDGPTSAVQTVSIGGAQNVSGLHFVLCPAGVITGKVVDENGDPFPQASVMVLQPAYELRKRTYAPVNQETTNDLGEYRLYGLAPGTYLVAASAQQEGNATFIRRMRFEQHPQSGRTVYPTVYYPNATDISDATPVQIGPGQEVHADFTLTPAHAVSISGVVHGIPKLQKGHYIQLALEPQSSAVLALPMLTAVDDDGKFSFDSVLPGAYTIFTVALGQQGATGIHGRMQIRVGDKDLKDVNLQVSASDQKLRGRIVAEGKIPNDFSTLNLVLNSLDDSPSSWVVDSTPVNISKAGTFDIPDFGGGRVMPTISSNDKGWEDWYIQSIRYGGQDVSKVGFETSGAGPLEVVIRGDGATVAGTVVDKQKKPVPNAEVTLVPPEDMRDRADLYLPTTTDYAGHFEIRGVMPGNYQVLALRPTNSDAGAWFDDDFLREHESDGARFTVRANDRETVQLVVLSGTDAK